MLPLVKPTLFIVAAVILYEITWADPKHHYIIKKLNEGDISPKQVWVPPTDGFKIVNCGKISLKQD